MTLQQGEIVQTIALSSMMLHLDKQQIIHITYLKGEVIDVKEKMEEKNALLQLTKGIKHPVLISFESYVTITKEAKEYSILIEREQPFLAVAILVENLAYQLMADFYFKFYKPKVAYNVFKSYPLAIEWLQHTKNNTPASPSKPKGNSSFWSF
jgi:hypothetical protein